MRPLTRRAATLLTGVALRLVTLPPGVASVRVVQLGFSPSDPRTAGSITFDDIGLFEE